jgi:hypothetical protein
MFYFFFFSVVLGQDCIIFIEDFSITKTPSDNGKKFYICSPSSQGIYQENLLRFFSSSFKFLRLFHQINEFKFEWKHWFKSWFLLIFKISFFWNNISLDWDAQMLFEFKCQLRLNWHLKLVEMYRELIYI